VDVWELIPPRREYIKRLVELAKNSEVCLGNVSLEDWRYLESLLEARWDEIKSPTVLERLTPIVKTIVKCLAEGGLSGNIRSLLNGDFIKRLVRHAGRCFRLLKPWERRSLSLSRLEYGLLRALIAAFDSGCIDKIRSNVLLKALTPIVEKLLKVVGKAFRGVVILAHEVKNVSEDIVKAAISLRLPLAYNLARQVAVKISRIAQAWGNRAAKSWPEDSGFIKYLLMMMSYRENYLGA
jgi:hypothetical protein